MSNVLYFICLMSLVQLVILILIYDIVVKKAKKIAERHEKLWHEKCHREGVLQKIIILEDAKCRSLASHPEDQEQREYINLQIEELWKSINEKEL